MGSLVSVAIFWVSCFVLGDKFERCGCGACVPGWIGEVWNVVMCFKVEEYVLRSG